MIAVGIDVSKGKSTVAILDGDGSIRAHPYEMNHSKAELDALIKYIKAVDDHPIILMEPTSHYHYPVLKAFLDAGLSPSLTRIAAAEKPIKDASKPIMIATAPGASHTKTGYLPSKYSICLSNSLWSAVSPGRKTS